MSKARTVLDPEKQSLIPGIGCSVFLHGGLLATALFFSVVMSNCGPRKPIIDIDRQMEVSLIAKSDLNVPQRASRAPEAKGTDTPTPNPEVEPPPVESDLTFENEQAETTEGSDTERDQTMEELKRQQLLNDLMNAPEGKVDRQASDPNGFGDITLNPNGVNSGDPELAAYVAKLRILFQEHFKPLATTYQNNPDIVSTLAIEIDPTSGRVLAYDVTKSSGNASYDAAAERAAQAVGKVPLPPERLAFVLGAPVSVNFRPR